MKNLLKNTVILSLCMCLLLSLNIYTIEENSNILSPTNLYDLVARQD